MTIGKHKYNSEYPTPCFFCMLCIKITFLIVLCRLNLNDLVLFLTDLVAEDIAADENCDLDRRPLSQPCPVTQKTYLLHARAVKLTR